MAQARFDRGAAPSDLPMDHVVLLLSRSAGQQDDLDNLLEDLNDPASKNFHSWLTPEEFGRRFGASEQDVQAVRSWLMSYGLQIDQVSAGRNLMEFSGTAGQLQRAFRTSIHRFVVGGESHWANTVEPTIPEALAPVIEGFASLHGFHSRPQAKYSPRPIPAGEIGTPLTTLSNGSHALSPADYAVQYNLKPLYQGGVNGAGVTIAVVGRTNINVQDVVDFRAMFGLSPNPPQVVVNGVDPGIVSSGEQMEATLDTTWAGAVAPNATVKLVVSKSTATSDGIFLSESYVVNNNLAAVMTISFGACEAQNSGSAASVQALAQQAAAQGITVVVSSGDSGSAGCDNPNLTTTATHGTGVNILASTPYNVAVGGTQLTEGTSTSYWGTSNLTGYGSLSARVPENVWNQSCASPQTGCTTANIWAGGGGVSTLFAKPAWQSGVPGIPADKMRDLPDVSLTASSHDPYLVCMQGSCQMGSFYLVSGTSASAPAFAGMMALVGQKTGARQGQANTTLYRLAAAQTYSQCNGSAAVMSNTACVFNDVTLGNNAVPGESGYGTASATYLSGTGFDLASGLGSVNAYNLVNQWATAVYSPSKTTLTVSPTAISSTGSATVSVAVAPASGTGTPTGSVALTTSTGVTLASLTLGSGSAVANVSGWPVGTYTVSARYGGDTRFAPSTSSAVSVTVTAPALPKVTLSATVLTFASTNVGSASAAQSITMINTGTGSLTGIAIGITGANAGDFAGSTTCGTTLAAGASCSISVAFKPTAVGSRTASVQIADNATGSPQLVSLSGTGVGVPAVKLSATSLNLGPVKVGSTSTAQSVTMTNSGTGLLSGVAISITGTNAGDYKQTTTCGTTLAPGAACTISVTFKPTVAGTRTASLSIADNATGAPQPVALTGSGK